MDMIGYEDNKLMMKLKAKPVGDKEKSPTTSRGCQEKKKELLVGKGKLVILWL